MFYVTYVTANGHSSTIHINEYKEAAKLFIMLASDNPYAQFGGVSVGIIEDNYTKFQTRMPTGMSFEDREIPSDYETSSN